jgi:DNA-directed RNA polymerase specialized sigma24 family protein
MIEAPTCEDLRPLLAHTYIDERAAWSVLLQFLPMVKRATARTWLARDEHRLGMGDKSELATDVMVRLVGRIRDHEGLARPDDCDERSPEAWFFTVVRNEAQSVQRAGNTASRRVLGEATSTTPSPGTPDSLERQRVEDDSEPEELLDLRRRLRRRVDRFETVDLPPPQRLVWACHYAHDFVTPSLVEAAVGWAYNDGAGAMRSAADTYKELEGWMETHGDRPTTLDARLHLAWILRSSDNTSPTTWRSTDPDAAAKGRDTLRQWMNRARERLAEVE